jgi:hypothetical protein
MAAVVGLSATQPSTDGGVSAGVVGGAPPRLDEWTFSVLEGLRDRKERRDRGERTRAADVRLWRVRVFPKAKEATLTPWRPVRLDRGEADQLSDVEREAERAAARAVVEARRRLREVELNDEFRRLVEDADELSDQRAVRRARSMIRRICREFNLHRMWTMTYRGAGCHDRAQMVRDMERFARDVKEQLPDVVWLAVPEIHPGGHGWHVHCAVSEYVHWRRFNRCWPHGETESPRGPDGQRLAGRIDCTATAIYLSKYVAKSLGEGREYLGQHRYFRPKGIEVTSEDSGATVIYGYDDARKVAIAYFGGLVPEVELESDQLKDHDGPPFAWLDFWQRRRSRRSSSPPLGAEPGVRLPVELPEEPW